MLASWHEKLTSADSAGTRDGLAGAQSPRKPAKARARAAKAAAWAIYGIMLPAVFTVVVIPGNATVNVVVITAAIIYSIFWLLGGARVLASRRAGARPGI